MHNLDPDPCDSGQRNTTIEGQSAYESCRLKGQSAYDKLHEIHGRDQSFGQSAYDELHEIGRGGFGVVTKAIHKASGDFVALKRIDSKHLTNASEIQSSIKEVEFLRPATYRNITNSG